MKAKRPKWFLFAIFLLLLMLMLTLTLTIVWRRSGDRAAAVDSASPAHSFGAGKEGSAQFISPTKAATRDEKPHRAALGRVAEGGVNPAWGLVVVDDLQGRPENGDQAYVARLGPEGGLMKVASVQANQVVLELGTLDPKDLQDGDRIETMPPAR